MQGHLGDSVLGDGGGEGKGGEGGEERKKRGKLKRGA